MSAPSNRPARASSTRSDVPGIGVARVGERDRQPVPRPLEPAPRAGRHDLAAGVVERRQRLERGERLGRQDVRIRGLDAATELEGGCGGHAATRPRAS